MPEKHKFLVDVPSEIVEWLDQEAEARDRSRVWMVAEVLRQYKNRLEKDRQRRQRARKRNLETISRRK